MSLKLSLFLIIPREIIQNNLEQLKVDLLIRCPAWMNLFIFPPIFHFFPTTGRFFSNPSHIFHWHSPAEGRGGRGYGARGPRPRHRKRRRPRLLVGYHQSYVPRPEGSGSASDPELELELTLLKLNLWPSQGRARSVASRCSESIQVARRPG